MSLAPGCQSEADHDRDLGRAQAVADYVEDHGPPPCSDCGETMAERDDDYRCEVCETERTRDDVLDAVAEGERWCSPAACPRGCREAPRAVRP